METISLCIASCNTLSRGKEVLERAISSISDSIKYLYSQKNDVKVIISWVDDASTDGTLNEVIRLSNLQEDPIKDNFFINSIQVNKGQAYCRNLAVNLYNSNYICLFDSDDEMYKDHLHVCLNMMSLEDKNGKKYALASTSLETSENDIHPDWISRMSNTAPITKIIRKEVWDFLEGMPESFIFKKIGQEDAVFLLIFQKFFTNIMTSRVTTKYWNYPGSNLDKQLKKFQTDPNNYVEDFSICPENMAILRDQFVKQKVEYLEQKLNLLNLHDNFNHLITKSPYN